MTAPEPLKLTTEEARQAYEKAAAELDRICQGPRHGFRMQIPAHPDDSDLVLGDALGALKQLIAERDEAAEPKPIGWDDVTDEDFIAALLDCQEELKQARDDAAELRAATKALLDPETHDPAYDPTFGPGVPSMHAVDRARAALATSEGQP